jgi:hypothetical protein
VGHVLVDGHAQPVGVVLKHFEVTSGNLGGKVITAARQPVKVRVSSPTSKSLSVPSPRRPT